MGTLAQTLVSTSVGTLKKSFVCNKNSKLHATSEFPRIAKLHCPRPRKRIVQGPSRKGISNSSILGPALDVGYRSEILSHKPSSVVVECSAEQKKPLHIMISGAPASGKGTQCEQIVQKYGLTHVSTGDLLRAEVAAGTENGKRAKAYMDAGSLVPDEVVINMVTARLAQDDAKERGWLLDGFPRTATQAEALESLGIRPDLFIVLDVLDEVLVDRVIGRRLDPLTGKIYHLKFSPPETEEIAARLTQRSDDTEEKVKARLAAHKSNVQAINDSYKDVIATVDGNRPKDEVFKEVDALLNKLLESNSRGSHGSALSGKAKQEWRGVPTQLNSVPHSREIREYFYKDVCQAVERAVAEKKPYMEVKLTIPELNPEMDVYRAGTLLELMRELALTFARDGKRVKVCVQGSMGEGVFSGLPLSIAGMRRMMEMMDWGDDDIVGQFIFFGAVGKLQVKPEDDMFIVACPQNAVGNCIIDDLQEMIEAAGDRPFIVVNARLQDIPSASGVMQIQGREQRRKFADSFFTAYNFRLLYLSASNYYPILGALRMAYPGPYEVYRREDSPEGERYDLVATLDDEEPKGQALADAYAGKLKKKETATNFWARLFS